MGIGAAAMGILKRMDELEEKLDACRVLLRMATKVPDKWRRQMEWAMALASRVSIPEEKLLRPIRSTETVTRVRLIRKERPSEMRCSVTRPVEFCIALAA